VLATSHKHSPEHSGSQAGYVSSFFPPPPRGESWTMSVIPSSLQYRLERLVSWQRQTLRLRKAGALSMSTRFFSSGLFCSVNSPELGYWDHVCIVASHFGLNLMSCRKLQKTHRLQGNLFKKFFEVFFISASSLTQRCLLCSVVTRNQVIGSFRATFQLRTL